MIDNSGVARNNNAVDKKRDTHTHTHTIICLGESRLGDEYF